MSENEKIKPRAGKLLLWMLPVSACGLGFSIELTRIYYRSFQDVEFDALCSISERLDCISTALSSYSRIIGLPNSIFGIAFHLAVILLVAFQLKSKRPVFKNARNYIFVLALFGFLYSLYLGAVSFFVLKNFCIYCTAVYLADIILFILAILALDPFLEFLQEFVDDGRSLMKDVPVFILVIGGALIFLTGFVLQSWRMQVHAEKRLEISLKDKRFDLDLEGDPGLGSMTAPVTIVEFTDYECPHCRTLHFVLKRIREKYGPRVRLIYKTFPIYTDCNQYLRSMAHPHACEAAYATECSYKFGVFEEYVDKLFSASDFEWDELVRMAEEFGLDGHEFETCMKSDEVWEAVQKDVQDASALKLRGTPIFFVNGYKFEGSRSFKDMSLIIDAFLHGLEPRR